MGVERVESITESQKDGCKSKIHSISIPPISAVYCSCPGAANAFLVVQSGEKEMEAVENGYEMPLASLVAAGDKMACGHHYSSEYSGWIEMFRCSG